MKELWITLPDDFGELLKKYKENIIGSSDMQIDKIISLKNYPIVFIDNEHTIRINNKECVLPPFKNEHYLCRVMFNNSPKVAVDWSEIFERMEGQEMKGGREEKKDMKSLQDTMYALNKRIKSDIGTNDDLFSWQNKSIIRNF